MQPYLLIMLEFKTLSLEDKTWVDELVMCEDCPCAGYNFGTIYLWNRNYRHLVARLGDRMVTKLRYSDELAFTFPVGRGSLRPMIEALGEYCAHKERPLLMQGVTEKQLAALEAEYPGHFEVSEDVDFADYIYLAERLATYSGKALHSKKNHCNRFEAENDWDFVPLTRELIPGCLDMLDMWTEENYQRLDKSITYEHEALLKCFAAYEKLGLEGGVLRVQGKIVGFSVGEFTSSSCFDVHFEKAYSSMNGAYPMVCREFTRMLMKKYPSLVYMNREDDMGLEALRRSKISYRPEFMLRKFSARWKDE